MKGDKGDYRGIGERAFILSCKYLFALLNILLAYRMLQGCYIFAQCLDRL